MNDQLMVVKMVLTILQELSLHTSLLHLSLLKELEKEELDHLIAELPSYLSHAANTDADINPIKWWKQNAVALPSWSVAAAKVLLLQPSSAAAERFFSLLRNCFGEQQDSACKIILKHHSCFNITLSIN